MLAYVCIIFALHLHYFCAKIYFTQNLCKLAVIIWSFFGNIHIVDMGFSKPC